MVIASVRTYSSVARLAVMMAIVPDSNRTWTLATSVTVECTAGPWAASRRGGESTRPSTMSMSWIMRAITTVSFCTRDANGPSRRAPSPRWPSAGDLLGLLDGAQRTLHDPVTTGPSDEVQEHADRLGGRHLLADPLDGPRRRQPAAIEDAERILKAAPVGRVHARAAQADHVDRARGGRLAFHQDVGRYVGRELRHPPDVRVGADARERHHAGEAADRRAVADLAVAGEARVVDDDHAVADPTVVRDVAQAHHQALATDVRPTLRARGAVHGHVLADDGVGAHAHARGRAVLVLEVLGHAAEHAAVADLHARAERHAALEHGVVADLDATLQRHLGADHAEGADPHPGLEPRARIDDRRGMDRVTHRAPPLRPSGPPPRASTARSSARTRCSSSGRRDSAAKIRRASIAGRAGVPR